MKKKLMHSRGRWHGRGWLIAFGLVTACLYMRARARVCCVRVCVCVCVCVCACVRACLRASLYVAVAVAVIDAPGVVVVVVVVVAFDNDDVLFC